MFEKESGPPPEPSMHTKKIKVYVPESTLRKESSTLQSCQTKCSIGTISTQHLYQTESCIIQQQCHQHTISLPSRTQYQYHFEMLQKDGGLPPAHSIHKKQNTASVPTGDAQKKRTMTHHQTQTKIYKNIIKVPLLLSVASSDNTS